MERKLNCWDFNGCGKAPGEADGGDFGPCLAPVAVAYNGCNSGINAGRACWLVAGTCCTHHRVLSSFARKLGDCHSCSFYQLVQREEGPCFMSCDSQEEQPEDEQPARG